MASSQSARLLKGPCIPQSIAAMCLSPLQMSLSELFLDGGMLLQQIGHVYITCGIEGNLRKAHDRHLCYLPCHNSFCRTTHVVTPFITCCTNNKQGCLSEQLERNVV